MSDASHEAELQPSEPPPPVGEVGAADRPAPLPARPARARFGRLPTQVRGTHRCMVLASGSEDVTAVDLGTGAIVRLRIGEGSGESGDPAFSSFDVVDVMWASDPERDDLAQPEAVSVERPPQLVGSVRGRRARRLLSLLLAPNNQPLLGFAGTSAPYWEFAGMRPSVAIVVPTRGPLLFRRRTDHSVWARFGWPRSDNWLPVEDRRAVAALWASRRDRLTGRDLAKALGFKPHFLVVALSRPKGGHCYKTVAAILPRP